MVFRMILPKWLKEHPERDDRELPNVQEGDFTIEQMHEINSLGYNAYFLPNYPDNYTPEMSPIDGTHINTFTSVFVDLDMKDYQSSNVDRRHDYATKQDFIDIINNFKLKPSRIVDSGNGIHVYWFISDLTDKDYLRFQRRLARFFHTDPEVSKIYQLMRVPGTINWKDQNELKNSIIVSETDALYTAEEMSKVLPRITDKDEAYCVAHYDKTHGLTVKMDVNDELPAKWFKLAFVGSEPHKLFYGVVKDRSAADFRLGHVLFSAGFTKEEAMSVLMNTNKASERNGIHRYNYAESVVTKIWTHVQEQQAVDVTVKTGRVRNMGELLKLNPDRELMKGQRMQCDEHFDGTEYGTRHGQVLGLIAGSGVGKTTFGFNICRGFMRYNPNLIHLVITLEQPELQYTSLWEKMCEGNQDAINRLYVLGNYNDDGTYRHLSIYDIEDEVKELERVTGKKVGLVMIDHIGVLKKENRNGENQGLIDICQYMKAFAVNTKTFLIMQSQAPREKASIGDIELDKDAAYGTVFFESFCDFVVTLWQPLKRLYDQVPNMTVTIFKFCKIRDKNVLVDRIKEDQRYPLMLDPTTGIMRLLTSDEMKSLEFHSKRATQLRSRDKKSEPGRIAVIDWVQKGGTNGAAGTGNPNGSANTTRHPTDKRVSRK